MPPKNFVMMRGILCSATSRGSSVGGSKREEIKALVVRLMDCRVDGQERAWRTRPRPQAFPGSQEQIFAQEVILLIAEREEIPRRLHGVWGVGSAV